MRVLVLVSIMHSAVHLWFNRVVKYIEKYYPENCLTQFLLTPRRFFFFFFTFCVYCCTIDSALRVRQKHDTIDGRKRVSQLVVLTTVQLCRQEAHFQQRPLQHSNFWPNRKKDAWGGFGSRIRLVHTFEYMECTYMTHVPLPRFLWRWILLARHGKKKKKAEEQETCALQAQATEEKKRTNAVPKIGHLDWHRRFQTRQAQQKMTSRHGQTHALFPSYCHSSPCSPTVTWAHAIQCDGYWVHSEPLLVRYSNPYFPSPPWLKCCAYTRSAHTYTRQLKKKYTSACCRVRMEI